jgi:hypothetical protein
MTKEIEWEQVYDNAEPFANYVSKGQPAWRLRSGTFYRTGGGGPECGYVEYKGRVYEVSRGWGEPFVAKLLRRKVLMSRKEEYGSSVAIVNYTP